MSLQRLKVHQIKSEGAPWASVRNLYWPLLYVSFTTSIRFYIKWRGSLFRFNFLSPTKLEFFAIYHACYKHQLINVKSGIKNIRWHNCEHYFYKKRTCSWSEKFRLRGKFPNVVSTSILFDCWRLLVETIFSMLNQNRNFRVTILNPERCIKYDRFKIRAFADQQNYQKYLFFLPRMMPLNTERKVFWKKLLL